jgi:hypothetical protein
LKERYITALKKGFHSVERRISQNRKNFTTLKEGFYSVINARV